MSAWNWKHGVAAVIVAGLMVGLRSAFAPREAAGPVGGVRGRTVAVLAEFLPAPTSIMTDGHPQWNEALGGRPGGGDNVWAYYTFDPVSHKYGTTCGVWAAYVAKLAGWPASMIDRREDDGGSGFVIGAPISRVRQGAKAEGWLHDGSELVSGATAPAVAGAADVCPFKPGDYYCVTHPGPNGRTDEHVGFVVSCSRNSDGSWRIETADGGQTDPQTGRQAATRTIRRLSGRTLTNTKTGQSGTVAWWVAPPSA